MFLDVNNNKAPWGIFGFLVLLVIVIVGLNYLTGLAPAQEARTLKASSSTTMCEPSVTPNKSADEVAALIKQLADAYKMLANAKANTEDGNKKLADEVAALKKQLTDTEAKAEANSNTSADEVAALMNQLAAALKQNVALKKHITHCKAKAGDDSKKAVEEVAALKKQLAVRKKQLAIVKRRVADAKRQMFGLDHAAFDLILDL